MHNKVVYLLISFQFVATEFAGLKPPLTWYEAHSECSQSRGKLSTGVPETLDEELTCGHSNLPKGCVANIDQLNKHSVGSVQCAECYTMCNKTFLYRFEEGRECFCIPNNNHHGNGSINDCYRDILKQRPNWWVFGKGGHDSLDSYGVCIPCSKTPHKPACIISRFLQAHKVLIVGGMYFCDNNDKSDIGLFRQNVKASAYDDSEFKLGNIIQCGFIHCMSRLQKYIQYKNCSSKTSYFCNAELQTTERMFESSQSYISIPLKVSKIFPPRKYVSTKTYFPPDRRYSTTTRMLVSSSTGRHMLETTTNNIQADTLGSTQDKVTGLYSTSMDSYIYPSQEPHDNTTTKSLNSSRRESQNMAGQITGGTIPIVMVGIVVYILYRKRKIIDKCRRQDRVENININRGLQPSDIIRIDNEHVTVTDL